MSTFLESAIAGTAEILESGGDETRRNIALAMLRNSVSPAHAMVHVMAMRMESTGGWHRMVPLRRFGLNDPGRQELLDLLTAPHLDWYVSQFSQMTTARLFAEALIGALSPDNPAGDRPLNRLCAFVLGIANGLPGNQDLGDSFLAFIGPNRRVILEVIENEARLRPQS